MNGDGDCYEVAARLVAFGGNVPEGAVLCHGTATGQGPIEGVEFGHAWVEYLHPILGLPMVIDKSNGNDWHGLAAVYYEAGECRDVIRYTADEARRMMVEHEHYGPWTD